MQKTGKVPELHVINDETKQIPLRVRLNMKSNERSTKPKLKSVIVPVMNSKADPPVDDEIVVSVGVSEDEFMSDDELDMEQIYPVEEDAMSEVTFRLPRNEDVEPRPGTSGVSGGHTEGNDNTEIPQAKLPSTDTTPVVPIDMEQMRNAVAEQIKLSKDKSTTEMVNAGMLSIQNKNAVAVIPSRDKETENKECCS